MTTTATSAKPTPSDLPPQRLVRHVFWKYPILAAVMFVLVVVVAAIAGSPNWPRDSIASVSKADPGGSILAFTQELDGASTSTSNAQEFGMGDPADVFVHYPLHQAAWFLGPQVQNALSSWDAVSHEQGHTWAANYEKALGTITPMGNGGDMEAASSPDYSKIDTLTGDFGPVPVMVKADLQLAQNGYLDQYLQSDAVGHSFHLVNIWLYDHPNMLNTAIAQGLTDDQWGMVKERGFSVGPWYLFIPAVIHVKLPGGEEANGFILWNLAFAAFLLFFVPLVPGIRSLPKYLKLYRFIYRYPRKGELDKPEFVERHGATHGN